MTSSPTIQVSRSLPYLREEDAEILERLKQGGISDLFDDEDTLGGRVPRQPLGGGVLNVPGKHVNKTVNNT